MIGRDRDRVRLVRLRADRQQHVIAVAARRDVEPVRVQVRRVEAADAGRKLEVRCGRVAAGRVVRGELVAQHDPQRVAGTRLDQRRRQAAAVRAQLELVDLLLRGVVDLRRDAPQRQVQDDVVRPGLRRDRAGVAGAAVRRRDAERARRRAAGREAGDLREGRAHRVERGLRGRARRAGEAGEEHRARQRDRSGDERGTPQRARGERWSSVDRHRTPHETERRRRSSSGEKETLCSVGARGARAPGLRPARAARRDAP